MTIIGSVILLIIALIWLPGHVGRVAREERAHQRLKYRERHGVPGHYRLVQSGYELGQLRLIEGGKESTPKVLDDQDYEELGNMFEGDDPEEYN